jgi:PHD/YefM family antitoxin component YafN of YafNO toxin-antitoxin module
MALTSKDIVPFKETRARLTELAAEACQGREKIITRNGKAYVALIDARQLDYYHRLERENIHLTLLEEVARGLDDVDAGQVMTVAELKSRYQRKTD